MYHMKTASIRDLRYRFPQIEARLRDGEAIDITKRKRVVARLVPVEHRTRRRAPPDFLTMLKEIYGEHVLEVSGAELVAEQRGRY
jgi:antitoxin (DNA-binding transcriptional repressor) of toxin-antitoxin stability system